MTTKNKNKWENRECERVTLDKLEEYYFSLKGLAIWIMV